MVQIKSYAELTRTSFSREKYTHTHVLLLLITPPIEIGPVTTEEKYMTAHVSD
jgi:hypothetical protein